MSGYIGGRSRSQSRETAKRPGGEQGAQPHDRSKEVFLESNLAVGGLPTTLPVAVLLLVQQLDRGSRDGLVHVAAGEAGREFSVPVSLREHRPASTKPGSQHAR